MTTFDDHEMMKHNNRNNDKEQNAINWLWTQQPQQQQQK